MDGRDVESRRGLHGALARLHALLRHADGLAAQRLTRPLRAGRNLRSRFRGGVNRNTTRVSGGRPKWTGRINLDRESIDAPRDWKRGRMIFVNSMSDLFHDKVPLAFIREIFAVMRETPQHTYQLLTKRAERLGELGPQLDWPSNVWMGVSVESAEFLWRIDHLRQVSAKTKFLSLEPLLGPLGALDLHGIDWAIAGGESGPGARDINPEWVRAIRDQCVKQNVAFHFKQWGGKNKKKTGRVLDGRTWDEFPVGTGAAVALA
jgi:protein gp37